jgi:hypothetical protein
MGITLLRIENKRRDSHDLLLCICYEACVANLFSIFHCKPHLSDVVHVCAQLLHDNLHGINSIFEYKILKHFSKHQWVVYCFDKLLNDFIYRNGAKLLKTVLWLVVHPSHQQPNIHQCDSRPLFWSTPARISHHKIVEKVQETWSIDTSLANGRAKGGNKAGRWGIAERWKRWNCKYFQEIY